MRTDTDIKLHKGFLRISSLHGNASLNYSMGRMATIILILLLLIPVIPAVSQNTFKGKYDNEWELKDGYFKVRKGRLYGVVSKDGVTLIPCEYNQIWDLGEDNILKVLKGRKIGLYTIDGAVIALPEYDQIWGFENGRARVMKNGKIGYIDKSGQEIIPPVYDQVWGFEDGRARVLRNGKIGYIDETGVEIIPPVYDQIWGFENGRARVLQNGKIGYIDEKGHLLIPPDYTQIWDFENGRAKVFKNGKFGYIDESGKEVIPPVYNKIWDFENGRAQVYKNGKFGYIDENGNEIIPVIYNKIWEFEDGRAKVFKNGKFGMIDENGNVLIAPKFDMIGEFEDGRADAVYNNKRVVIDTTGNIVETGSAGGVVTVDKKIAVTDTVIPETGERIVEVNDSIFNDSTVVRIWSDRVEIVSKKHSKPEEKHTYVEYNEPNRKKRGRFKGHWAGLNVGYNNLLTSSGSFEYPDEYMFMEMNAGKSVGVAANPWQQSIKLQRRGNIGLVTGLGFEWNNYRFDSQYVLTRDETTGNTTYYTETKPIKRNKLTTIYLNVPLLLEFQIPTGRERYPFYISGGAIGGVKLGSHTKLVYQSEGKEKNKDSFNLTTWRYGVTARIGYRAINLFADYYFSPLFEKDKGPDLYQVSAGIFIYLDY